MQIALRRAAAVPAAAAAPAPRTAAPVVAAVLSLGAAWVHLAYTASHLRQWWAYGAFFLATGAGQALFAPLVLRRPRQWVAAVGVAGNLAIVAMYVMSRTVGPPLGPHAHVPEPAGAVDLATTAVEIALVGVLLTLLGGRSRRWVANLLLGAGVLLWALRLGGGLP
jgi:peptidoglycan/LPS O-acetylase OafA/YrhL